MLLQYKSTVKQRQNQSIAFYNNDCNLCHNAKTLLISIYFIQSQHILIPQIYKIFSKVGVSKIKFLDSLVFFPTSLTIILFFLLPLSVTPVKLLLLVEEAAKGVGEHFVLYSGVQHGIEGKVGEREGGGDGGDEHQRAHHGGEASHEWQRRGKVCHSGCGAGTEQGDGGVWGYLAEHFSEAVAGHATHKPLRVDEAQGCGYHLSAHEPGYSKGYCGYDCRHCERVFHHLGLHQTASSAKGGNLGGVERGEHHEDATQRKKPEQGHSFVPLSAKEQVEYCLGEQHEQHEARHCQIGCETVCLGHHAVKVRAVVLTAA